MILITVFRSVVLVSGFPVMAGLAKSLPVAFIPHQMRITTVRNDMVDHGRCREPSLCFAPHTQRMPAEVRLAQSLPLAAVATLGSRQSVWMQGLMLCTIQTVCQIGTTGMLAGFQCLPRHKVHLRLQRKPMWVYHRAFGQFSMLLLYHTFLQKSSSILDIHFPNSNKVNLETARFLRLYAELRSM